MCEVPMEARWAVKAARASAVRWGSGGGGGGGGGGGCSRWVVEGVEAVVMVLETVVVLERVVDLLVR